MPGDGVGIIPNYGALTTDKKTGRMQVGALIGNLDPNTIADNITAVKLQKSDTYKDNITLNVDKKIPAIEELRTKVEALGSSLKKLTNDLKSNFLGSDSSIPNALNSKISRSRGKPDGAIVLSIDPIAKPTLTDHVISVTQKAKADSITCGIKFTSPNDPVTFSGNLVINNQVISITAGESTLNTIMHDINSTTDFSNVVASSLYVSSTKGYELILDSTKLAEPINFLGNAGTDALILGASGLNITPTNPNEFDATAIDTITTGYVNTSKTAAVGFTGNLVINNQPITITNDSTLTSIMDSINYISDKTNVTASISAGPNYTLVFTSTEIGVPIKFDALTTDTSLQGNNALVPSANTNAADIIGIKDKITSDYATLDPTTAANFKGNLLINNQLITINESASLNAIRDSINALSKEAHVIASITTDESGMSKLSIESTQIGAPIDFTGKTTDSNLRGTDKLIASTTNTDADSLIAKLSINGRTIERPSNIISDAIMGVKITIEAESTENTIFAIDYDKTQAFSAINDFVTSYNLVVDAVNEQRKMQADGKTPDEKAILYGEDILNQIDSLLRNSSNTAAVGSNNKDYKCLADIGIMLNSNPSDKGKNELSGKLTVNTQLLQERMLNDDFGKIVRLFGNFAQSTDPQFYAFTMPEKLTEEMAGQPITLTYSYVGATSDDETFSTNFIVPEPTKALGYSVAGQTVSLTYALIDDGATYSATITGSNLKDERGNLIPSEKLTATAILTNNNQTFTFPENSLYAGLVVNFKDDATPPTANAPITTTFTLPQFTATLSMKDKDDVVISNVQNDLISSPEDSIYKGFKIGYIVMGKYLPLALNQSMQTTLTLTEGIAVGFDKAIERAIARYNPSKNEVASSTFDVSIHTLLEENKNNEDRIKEIIDDAERVREHYQQDRKRLYMQAHKTAAISHMLAAELASHYG